MYTPVDPTRFLAGRTSLVAFCASRLPYLDLETMLIVRPAMKFAPPPAPVGVNRETACIA
jgi:hypothetical protein